jgi:hypothetical protein
MAIIGVPFDQHRDSHAEWLLAQLHKFDLDGFYEAQDIADMLQGKGRLELPPLVREYKRRKSEMKPGAFLDWVSRCRAVSGLGVDPEWERAEMAARRIASESGKKGP